MSQNAGPANRYSESSLLDFLLDLHLLSNSDYLVCTFSSNVSRLAFELSQQNYADSSRDKAKSVDEIWSYQKQNDHQLAAIMGHNPEEPNELELQAGDIISLMDHFWNGYSWGLNHRTNVKGIFPEYKTREEITIDDFDA